MGKEKILLSGPGKSGENDLAVFSCHLSHFLPRNQFVQKWPPPPKKNVIKISTGTARKFSKYFSNQARNTDEQLEPSNVEELFHSLGNPNGMINLIGAIIYMTLFIFEYFIIN